MKVIIKNCIADLRAFAKICWHKFFEWQYYKCRANFLAEILQKKLEKNQEEQCIWLILEQYKLFLRRIGLKPDSLEAQNYQFEQKHETPIPADHFYNIIKKYHLLIKAKQKTSSLGDYASGVKIIHRIWLREFHQKQKLTAISATNKAVEHLWYDAVSGKKIKVKQIIWTDIESLLTSATSHDILAVRDINSLLDYVEFPEVSELIDICLKQKKYHFAAEMFKLLILFQYGGMFLEGAWRPANHDLLMHFFKSADRISISTNNQPKTKIFTPTVSTFKIYKTEPACSANVLLRSGVLQQISSLKILLEQKAKINDLILFHDFINSSAIYVGKAFHPVFEQALINCSTIINFWRKTLDKHDSEVHSVIPLKLKLNELNSIEELINSKNFTGLFPLAQAFVDFGYIHFAEPFIMEKTSVLDEANSFEITNLPGGLFLSELDIFRPHDLLFYETV